MKQKIEFHPVRADRWKDVEILFGKGGACGGCWCQYWRVPRAQFEKEKGAGLRKRLKKLVDSGKAPGILAYENGEPVGWCSFGPRTGYSTLERSRILKPVDDKPVWSVVCFFIKKTHRKRGLTVELLKAAVRYAKTKGAQTIEGYPVEPKKGAIPDVFAYTGIPSAFQKAGFREVVRRSETRPIMRLDLKPQRR